VAKVKKQESTIDREKLNFIGCGVDVVVVDADVADADRVDDGKCATASPRAVLSVRRRASERDGVRDGESPGMTSRSPHGPKTLEKHWRIVPELIN
jgi:hypothetical protein